MYVAEITTVAGSETKALWGEEAWSENQAMIKLHEIMLYQRQNEQVTKSVCAVMDGDFTQYYVERYVKETATPEE